MALRRAIPHITLQQDAYICLHQFAGLHDFMGQPVIQGNRVIQSPRQSYCSPCFPSPVASFDHNGEELTTMVSLTREIPERHQGG